SAALLATAEQERTAIRSKFPRLPIAVIANGVDCAAVPPATDPHSKTVLFLSRIHPKKNLIGLLDAWAIVSAQPAFAGWRLVIAGPDEGGHLAEVRRHAERSGLRDSVDFHGAVADGDKAAVFASAALFVLPSHSENFGIVVAEALAAGLPVVATRGAPWDGLRGHRAGWWVDPTPAALAGAIGSALALPAAERRAMGERGHAWVAAAFGWEGIAAATARLYRWVITGGAVPEFVDV
ncbi:MAG: glycosyltransferase, partial [Polymorphobacter sp.]